MTLSACEIARWVSEELEDLAEHSQPNRRVKPRRRNDVQRFKRRRTAALGFSKRNNTRSAKNSFQWASTSGAT